MLDTVAPLRQAGSSGAAYPSAATAQTPIHISNMVPSTVQAGPPAAAQLWTWGFRFAFAGRPLLANDVNVTLDVHDVTVLWDGQPRHFKAGATGGTPLEGMLFLGSRNLNIEVGRSRRRLKLDIDCTSTLAQPG